MTPAMPTLDPREFRRAIGNFATGVTVVTTRDASGTKVGMTVNSFSSLSLNPPLVLWSIDRQTGCFDAFNQSDAFAVHVLKATQKNLSEHFAGRGFDKFDAVPTDENKGGVPLLKDCAARFQCTVEHRYDGGDHSIIVGRVRALEYQSSAPLIFCQGQYAALDDPERIKK